MLNSKKDENGFICLPNEQIFPVTSELDVKFNMASKLFVRDFHHELILILNYLRTNNERGAVFYGPSGIGKSWASIYVLINEIKNSEKKKNSVVYFKANTESAYVFSKNRCVYLESINKPNAIDIPELKDIDTVLIYDASSGNTDQLLVFNCEILIFSSPKAGNYKQAVREKGLQKFICPNWNIDELLKLGKGYEKPISTEIIVNRFDKFGGFPRNVFAREDSSGIRQRKEGLINWYYLMNKALYPSYDWPSNFIMGKYNTTEIAATDKEAYEKYLDINVQWDLASLDIMQLLREEFEKLTKDELKILENWLASQPVAMSLYGFVFENRVKDLLGDKVDMEVKVLKENVGFSSQQQDMANESAEILHNLNWTYPPYSFVQEVKFGKIGNSFKMEQLCTLNDPKVLYRMPPGFPLMDYFNPPNNCFSCNVGEKHTINLKHALDLCDILVFKQINNQVVKEINFIHVTTEKTFDKMNYRQSFFNGQKQMTLNKLAEEEKSKLSPIVQFCLRFKNI